MDSPSRTQAFSGPGGPSPAATAGRIQGHVELDQPIRARVLELPDLSPRVDRESIPPDLGPQEPWRVRDWAKAVTNDPNLVALDTETTGLGGAALEVGVVDRSGATIYHAYIQPLEPIHPKAAQVHGLTEERLAELGARPWGEVSLELREVLQGRTVAAYSDTFFDKAVLEKTDALAGTSATAPNAEWVDVMRPYQTARGDYKPMKLVEASGTLGVPLTREEAHGAIADARAAMGVLQALGRQEGPVLGQEEAFLRVNHRGSVEAFNEAGERLDLPAHVLNDRMGDSLAYEWAKPTRAVETIQRGGFIRVELAGMAQRLEPSEPEARFAVENDFLGDDWPHFKTYREAEDYVWQAAAEIAKANVDEDGVGNSPAFQGFTEREITERIYEENVGSIEKRLDGHTEPTAWINPYTKQIDHLMGEAGRGARAQNFSSAAAVAGARAIESGQREAHDEAKSMHQLAAQEHKAFATNFNPAVADHAFKLAALHERAAAWHQERGSVFAKPADFRTDQTTDLFYIRKYGQANPPERAETTRAIAGKPVEERAV